jgi:hypothetical protein
MSLTDDALNSLQWQTDPLADDTVARIVGPHQPHPWGPASSHWQRIATANRLFSQWTDNASLDMACQPNPGDPEEQEIAQILTDYVQSAKRLPDWADSTQLQQAENTFLDHSVLSCTLLFCASLPECYVIPDLSSVLHTSGQLEAHTEHRIRSTAAMIFPVMFPGGLTSPQGNGIVQVLKVRLIHATIRHLILRGSPQRFSASTAATPLEALPASAAPHTMHGAMYRRGWDVQRLGLPCNQEEQAYTLLTFNLVFLRGMRQLGVGLSAEAEAAYLHAWNVVGHLLGLQPTLMAQDMAHGQALFEQMQARGRSQPVTPDPRPALTEALMQTLSNAIPWAPARPWPRLLTRHLCGAQTAQALSLDTTAPWYARLLFWLLLALCRGIDFIVRLVVPGFSLSGALTRVIGRPLMSRLLLDQTRPLNLPEHLLNHIGAAAQGQQATTASGPAWLRALERRFAPGPSSTDTPASLASQ